jgi:Protein of unknown function (DUF3148)
MSSTFPIGTTVRLIALPAYVKTAEPKPMLRPPHVIQLGEEGIVMDRRPGDYWGVKFRNGVFLMEAQYLEPVVEPTVESAVEPTVELSVEPKVSD